MDHTKMAGPKVSVVIKTYDDTAVQEQKRGNDIVTSNLKVYLQETLDKLSIQEYQPLEVLIVDSSKGDGIVRLLHSYDPSSKGLIARRIPMQDFSHPKALNLGIKEARGDIVVSLSGDATPVDSLWLKSLVARFDEPNIAGVWGSQVKRPLKAPDLPENSANQRQPTTTPWLERFRLWWRYEFVNNLFSGAFALFSNANSAINREIALQIPVHATRPTPPRDPVR